MGQIITVDFHDHQLLAFEHDGKVLIAARPIAESMGIDWPSQYKRLLRDPILAEAVVMMTTPFGRHGQDEVCLPLDMLNGWLFTIDESRVKDDATRQKVLTYKRECYRVLFEHFHGRAAEDAVGEVLPPPHAEQRPFPDWTLEELRTKGQTVDRYRITLGLPAAQWIMPQLGFPLPPPEILRQGRQIDLFSLMGEEEAA